MQETNRPPVSVKESMKTFSVLWWFMWPGLLVWPIAAGIIAVSTPIASFVMQRLLEENPTWSPLSPQILFGVMIPKFVTVLVPLLLLWKYVFVPMYLRAEREKRNSLGVPTCLHCGYDLKGSTGPACPECGESLPEEEKWGAAGRMSRNANGRDRELEPVKPCVGPARANSRSSHIMRCFASINRLSGMDELNRLSGRASAMRFFFMGPGLLFLIYAIAFPIILMSSCFWVMNEVLPPATLLQYLVPITVLIGSFSLVACLWSFRWFGAPLLLKSLRKEMNSQGIPVCLRCGYDLKGSVGAACPECGERIPESELAGGGGPVE